MQWLLIGVQTAKQWRFHLTAQRQPSPLLRCAGSSAGPGAAVSAAGAAAAWGGPALACSPWPAGQRACYGPAHGSGVGQGGASGPLGGGIWPEEAPLCARVAGRRRPDWKLGAAGRAGRPWAALGWCQGTRADLELGRDWGQRCGLRWRKREMAGLQGFVAGLDGTEGDETEGGAFQLAPALILVLREHFTQQTGIIWRIERDRERERERREREEDERDKRERHEYKTSVYCRNEY